MHQKSVKHSGFTLIELIVTVSIAAILLSMAIPSFIGTIASNRLTTNDNELVTALNIARSEAIKRGVQITLKRKGTTSQAWEEGWDVFVDIAGTPAGNVIGTFLDDGDTTECEIDATGTPTEDCYIKHYQTLSNGFTVRTGANFANWVAYLPSGISTSSTNFGNDTFRLCNGTNTATARAITINAVGRASVTQGTASCP
jgi:type IV fimbrial biogenesis protein FimT